MGKIDWNRVDLDNIDWGKVNPTKNEWKIIDKRLDLEFNKIKESHYRFMNEYDFMNDLRGVVGRRYKYIAWGGRMI